MNRLFITLLLVLFIIHPTFSQQDVEVEVEDNYEGQNPQGQFSNEQQMEQQLNSMRRTACLVLARQHSNTQREQIEAILKQMDPEGQQKYVNKMYSTAVQICEAKITPSEVQELFVENNEFQPSHLFHNFQGMDYVGVNFQEPLTENQQNIAKYMKKFDEEMEVKREEKQAEKQKLEGDQKFDLKLFGYSFGQVSTTAKMVYLAIIALLIIGALFYGFSKLDSDKNNKKSSKRRKVSPKKQ